MADGIKIGNLDISAFKVGSSDCKVYLGDTLLYPKSVETRVVAKYNVTDTSNPTKIANKISGFSVIEIDGVVQPSVVSAYTFNTTGEHTVEYKLKGTTIGTSAFYYCPRLTSITIPDSVTSIGKQAFEKCYKLSMINSNIAGEVNIPSGVTSINSNVFNGCSGLTSVNIPSGVTSIGTSAFYGCSGITSIVIPDSVTSIGNYAFQWCERLTSCTIGSGITSIGQGVFMNTTRTLKTTIEAITPPTLGTNAFSTTGSNLIYVPCDSVDTYKAARVWSNYASKIQAIPGSCGDIIS